MSAQPQPHISAPQPLPALELRHGASAKPSLLPRFQTMASLLVFSVLALSPSATGIGYERGVAMSEIVIVMMVIAMFIGLRHRSRSSAFIDKLALFWGASEIASTLWSYYTGWGPRSPYPAGLFAGGQWGALQSMLGTLAGIAIYFASTSSDEWAGQIPTLRRCLPVLLPAAAVALLCILEAAHNRLFETSDPRIQASFTNPNLLGAFLCLTLPLAAGCVADSKLSTAARILSATLAVSLLIDLLWTQSRGAILGCAIALSFLAWSCWVNRTGDRQCASSPYHLWHRKLRPLAAIGWAVVVIAGGLAAFPHMLHQPRGASDAQRKAAWHAGLLIIRSHPWLGVGIGGFPAAMKGLRLLEFNPATPDGRPPVPALHLHAHDLILQSWAERGLPGLAAIVLLITFVLGRAQKIVAVKLNSRSAVALGATASILAYLAQSVVDYTLWYAPVGILFWYVLGLMTAPLSSDNLEEQRATPQVPARLSLEPKD